MNDLTIHEAIKLAVTVEQLGAKLYRRFAERLADKKEVADIFLRLAKDEAGHEKQFTKLLEQYPKDEADKGRFGVNEYLKATAVSEFFRKDIYNDLEQIDSAKDALEVATRLERATLLYYQALKDSLSSQNAINELIEAEKSHLVTLMEVVVSDVKFRGI